LKSKIKLPTHFTVANPVLRKPRPHQNIFSKKSIKAYKSFDELKFSDTLTSFIIQQAPTSECGELEEYSQSAMGGNMATMIRARHILVDSEKEANDLWDMVQKGDTFEELARNHSKCPSGRSGGDLGIFGRGQMVPEFEEAAYSLSDGQISKPVRTQFGYHLIERIIP